MAGEPDATSFERRTAARRRARRGRYARDRHNRQTCWQIHRQQRSAWTHEIDLRPFKETVLTPDRSGLDRPTITDASSGIGAILVTCTISLQPVKTKSDRDGRNTSIYRATGRGCLLVRYVASAGIGAPARKGKPPVRRDPRARHRSGDRSGDRRPVCDAVGPLGRSRHAAGHGQCLCPRRCHASLRPGRRLCPACRR